MAKPAGLPGDTVAFLLYRFHGPLSSLHSGGETDFPVSLADLERVPYARPRQAGTWLRGRVEANGWTFVAEAWIGRDAAGVDAIALERLVASLRFPPLREGTGTGEGFYVLGRADAYPVGSVTRFGARQLPVNVAHRETFYLVRAPRRFYALAGVCDHTRGYAGCPGCAVRYEAEAQEFSCALGARWDRLGRVLANPNRRRFVDDGLVVFATKVRQDGHVLVSTNSYAQPRHELVPDPWRR